MFEKFYKLSRLENYFAKIQKNFQNFYAKNRLIFVNIFCHKTA